jgi:hypothetical protein
MTQKRKAGVRHPCSFRVDIRYGRRYFFSAKACNLSAEGMFLKTTAVTLPPGTHVVLEFRHRGEDWLVPAVAIHNDKRGVALKFQERQPQLFRSVAGAIGSAGQPPTGGARDEPTRQPHQPAMSRL